jgi:UDP-N-acetylglucosamine--N-acetylmuramyl-(pentapeptide) pyrophosphoryl-undecaprenol N-acetylglucosamine transferase
MRLLIAAGGTGGHIYPALAVARALQSHSAQRADAIELSWLGGHRGLEAGIVRGAGFPIQLLALRSLRSVELSPHAVLDPLRLGASIPQAAAILARERPAAIFTTGGYVAIPVLMAAAALRIPVAMWEGNVIPGRSVRATARLADVLAVSFPGTCARLGRDGTSRSCFVTGTPIRDTRGIDRAAARERLDIPRDARVLLVFGGSQAVRRFNGAVAGALPRLVERAFVLHVTGDAGYAEALSGREALPADVRDRYRPYPFLRDEMLPALAAADLVVGRAGSSTLAEVAALGLPMVVVPYPHAAGHQRANARVLVEAGGARFVEDEAFDSEALLEAAEILHDPARHAEMAAASRALGRPAAAEAVARLVLVIADRRELPDADEVDRLSRGESGSAELGADGRGSERGDN